MTGETSLLNASVAACHGPTTATVVVTTTATTSSADDATTAAAATTTTSLTTTTATTALRAVPAPASDPLLALWIVLGVVAGLAVVGGVGFFAFKRLTATKAQQGASAAAPAAVPLATFDPNARYGEFGIDEPAQTDYAEF